MQERRHRSPPPSREPRVCTITSKDCQSSSTYSSSDIDTGDDDMDNNSTGETSTDSENHDPSMYIPVIFHSKKVHAMLDSGCDINVMSETLFKSLPKSCKSNIDMFSGSRIMVADSRYVDVKGTAKVKARMPFGTCEFEVYVLCQTSHPLIIGSRFMRKHNITLNFSTGQYMCCKYKIKSTTELTINPYSECVVLGKLPKGVYDGVQGLCTGSKQLHKSGLLVARSVNTVQNSRLTPIKILNPCPTTIVVHRNTVLADFERLDGTYTVLPVHNDDAEVNVKQYTHTVSSVHIDENVAGMNFATNSTENTTKVYKDNDVSNVHVLQNSVSENVANVTFLSDQSTERSGKSLCF